MSDNSSDVDWTRRCLIGFAGVIVIGLIILIGAMLSIVRERALHSQVAGVTSTQLSSCTSGCDSIGLNVGAVFVQPNGSLLCQCKEK